MWQLAVSLFVAMHNFQEGTPGDILDQDVQSPYSASIHHVAFVHAWVFIFVFVLLVALGLKVRSLYMIVRRCRIEWFFPTSSQPDSGGEAVLACVFLLFAGGVVVNGFPLLC